MQLIMNGVYILNVGPVLSDIWGGGKVPFSNVQWGKPSPDCVKTHNKNRYK